MSVRREKLNFKNLPFVAFLYDRFSWMSQFPSKKGEGSTLRKVTTNLPINIVEQVFVISSVGILIIEVQQPVVFSYPSGSNECPALFAN